MGRGFARFKDDFKEVRDEINAGPAGTKERVSVALNGRGKMPNLDVVLGQQR
ncbi:MAG: hypothetical protein P8M80_01000 [Pirellulaceae bacterium]|nr:hypothetical protein [Pirellulaceae bacterium]